MKNLKKFSRKLFKSESGQGATEYILLLVVVVGLVLMFKKPITDALNDQITKVKEGMAGITVN